MSAASERAERNEKIAEMTRAGLTTLEIAAWMQLSKRTVTRARRKVGASIRGPEIPMSADELRRAEIMFEDGCSASEVARTLGRSPSAILRKFPGRGWTHVQCGEYAAVVRQSRKVLQ